MGAIVNTLTYVEYRIDHPLESQSSLYKAFDEKFKTIRSNYKLHLQQSSGQHDEKLECIIQDFNSLHNKKIKF